MAEEEKRHKHLSQTKCHHFVIVASTSGEVLEQKVVQVPASATEDDLDILVDLFEEDIGRFFEEDDLECADFWTIEIKNTIPDYEAIQEEGGEWDLRPSKNVLKG